MEDQKKRQVAYHEAEVYSARTPREADNSNPLIAWLNGYRLRTVIGIIGTPLSGKTVLSVCGGDGEEAQYLRRRGAAVTIVDLCASAVEAARLRSPEPCCLCMDAESLAFADASFDWAIVREGLHHLARPVKALYELERVSREGFAIMEGQDSLLVRLLVALGLGEDWDPAGGYVYRFSRREIHKIFSSVETLSRWRLHTAWLPFGSDALRYCPAIRCVYPVVNRPWVRRILTSRAGRRSLKALYRGLNLVAGRWGNCLIAVAWKKPL
jgi:ubiquinone/menaquinone biosynthesis C-methylase UbiE